MLKKIILLIFTLISSVFLLSHSLVAQDEKKATETSDILERVKEKVLQAKINPKAYLGTVTDKTENSLQIKNENGEIQLLSIDPQNTTFAKIDKKTTPASFSEVAIGDFIIGLGFVNENKVLDTKRVLITNPPTQLERQIFLGEVLSVAKRQITIELKDKTTKTINFPTRWKGPEMNEIDQGAKVLIIAQPDSTQKLILRTIKIISSPTPKKPTPTL